MAFKIAGSMAFKEAMKKADPVLLEPIMKVAVTVPDEYMGDVIGDLNSRRGQIQGHGSKTGYGTDRCYCSTCLKCSVMQLTFVPKHRAADSIQWSLSTILKFRSQSLRKLWLRETRKINKFFLKLCKM